MKAAVDPMDVWCCTWVTDDGGTRTAQRWRDGAGKAVRRMSPPHSIFLSARTTRVVLAACHRDHDPMNNEGSNLAALCQRCHILHDKAEHLRRRSLTYLARRALGDLFTGPYRL